MTDAAAERHARQVQAWNGPMGEQWAASEARTERGLAPVLAALMDWAAPAPGMRIVDVGCGAGGTTLALARTVGPEGHVTGLDVSAVILEAARARLADQANVALTQADALTWALPGAPADLLFSRFGVMFFGDPVAAFTNLRRSLKPGGRFAFATWAPLQENPWIHIPYQAALSTLPPPAPPLPAADPAEPGQFAFGTPALVLRLLHDAGYPAARVRPFDFSMRFPADDLPRTAAGLANMGQTGRLLRDQPEPVRQQAAAAIAEAIAPHARGQWIDLPARTLLYEARR